jgi:hypothetical protein
MKKQLFTIFTAASLCSLFLAPFSLHAQIPNYVPTNGLVGWWPFNGNANDESGNGNNGTVNGATLTADRFGNANKAYSFDGVDDYIDVGNPLTLGNNPTSYTQAGWVYFPDFLDAFVFMSKRHDNTGNDWATPVTTTNGTFIFFADDAFYQNAPLAESNALLIDQWYHVSFVKSSNSFSIYINGVLESSISDNHILNGSTNNLIIGAQLAWPEFMKGKLDDIGIWNRALTDCEIQQLYNISIPSSTQTQTALDAYTWPVNGQTYTQSGTYTDTLTNAAGCDSIVTLNLTLSYTGIEELNPTANKQLVKITDLNGKETPFRKNTVLLFIYDDGTVERVYVGE